MQNNSFKLAAGDYNVWHISKAQHRPLFDAANYFEVCVHCHFIIATSNCLSNLGLKVGIRPISNFATCTSNVIKLTSI